MITKSVCAIVFGFALLTPMCYEKGTPGSVQYEEMRTIPTEKTTERKARFDSYSVEQQIDLYEFVKVNHPFGFTDVVGYVENNGDYYAPLIVERVAHNCPLKLYIIYSLSDIDYECKCITSDPVLMKKLENSKETISSDDTEYMRTDKQYINEAIDRLLSKARTKNRTP